MPNRLARETSPYLRQHADNPVDWYPWGEEALQKAKAEDKPIFLSIGYSACHWCHVLEDESFQDKRVAAILNSHYVSIKVDREERPDLDQIYMGALQTMTSQGGWPMSLFLTPDGEPFFGGTYFPPKPRGGMPAFPDILRAVADAWQNRRSQILESSRKLADQLRGRSDAILCGSEETDLKAETLDYVIQGMTHPEGGFRSTQDADSEGVEGKYYLWTLEEILGILGRQALSFTKAYGVTEQGNFEGKNILSFAAPLEERQAFASARRKLLEARRRRIAPNRDDKVLTSWNGLMLAAFAETARSLHREDYRQVAENNAGFLLRQLRSPDGQLRHSWKDGIAKTGGYLEDYANLIDGLVELYQTTFDPVWYLAARSLAETMIQQFGAPTGFYDTGLDHEKLILRPRELQDNAVPSGNSMAAFGLLRLAGLAIQSRYEDIARASIIPMQPLMERHPLGFGQWLIALDYTLSHPREIAIVGKPQEEDTQAMLEVVSTGFRPHQVIAAARPGSGVSEVPLLEGRDLIDGRAAAYVCVDYFCRPPITDPEALQALLDVSSVGNTEGKPSEYLSPKS